MMDELETVDNDTSEEFKVNSELLNENIFNAFVFTTRIDDMKITKNYNNLDRLMEILEKSKPKYIKKNVKKNIFENPCNNIRYDLKKYQENPDFNWEKKKKIIGYSNVRCLRDVRRLCKPVTVDLFKNFENCIVNGKVKSHLLKQNIDPSQNVKKETVCSETIGVCSDKTDIENVSPLGIQIVETRSLSTQNTKYKISMKINFKRCQSSLTPQRAILVMIDEKQNSQKTYDVQIGSCFEIKNTYGTFSSRIHIKYCCYCKRNSILQNLVKNKVFIPVTTLDFFRQNVSCSTNACSCCCKFTKHTDVICYFHKHKHSGLKSNAESAIVQSMKKIDTVALSKYQYKYVHKYIDRGIQETEEIYIIFSYVKKYSNVYNPKHKYEVFHFDKLSRIKSHLTYIKPPALRADSLKYVFEICCWFKRVKTVHSLELGLCKLLPYLRIKHSCSFNNCNCCCSTLGCTILINKDWDVRNFPLPAHNVSTDIDIQRARLKISKIYENCAQTKNIQTCPNLNLQASSEIPTTIAQELPQTPVQLINKKNNFNKKPNNFSNNNIESELDIENSLPAYVLAARSEDTHETPPLKNNDNKFNCNALELLKHARIELSPDKRITAIFSKLDQKLSQVQLMGLCKILNIAQKHVHLIDFNKENAMEDLMKLTLSQYNDDNNATTTDCTSVPIITDVFSLAEPDNLNIQTEPLVNEVINIAPKTDHPMLYSAIADQPNIRQSNTGQPSATQYNFSQAKVFFPVTVPGNFINSNVTGPNIIQQNNILANVIQQSNIQQNNILSNIIQQSNIQQNNILSNVIQQNNISSNVAYSILTDNVILLPRLVVAPNYNQNIVNTITDNSTVRQESHQATKRLPPSLLTIEKSVKRFATEKLITPFTNLQGQQENLQNEVEMENVSESILGL